MAICLTGLTFLSSCQDDPIVPKTKTELLCSKSWKLSGLSVNPGIDIGGVVITDFLTQIESCTKDDIYIYVNDGRGTIDEGATKCSPTDPQSSSFTWVFSADESKLTENNTDTYDILQLDESILKTSIIYDGSEIGGVAGIKYKLTSTYSH